MKFDVFSDEVNIKYTLRYANEASDVLVVVFPGIPGFMADKKLLEDGLMNPIYSDVAWKLNCHALSIVTDRDMLNASHIAIGGNCSIERSTVALIEFAARKTNSKQIVLCGPSLGGRLAMYYGLKYDYAVIAGTPACGVKLKTAEYMSNYKGNDALDWYDDHYLKAVKEAQERKYDKRFYVCWGRGEPNWVDPEKGPKLIAQLNDAKIKHTLELLDFSIHQTISGLFPHILNKQLKICLGLVSENDIDQDIPVAQLTQQAVINCIVVIIPKIEELAETPGNLNIKSPIGYGDEREDIQLRTYVYAVQGYHWFPTEKEPYHCNGTYWGDVPIQNFRYSFSFWYPQTILNRCKKKFSKAEFDHISENIYEFVQKKEHIKCGKYNHKTKWWVDLQQAHFFLDYLSFTYERGIEINIELQQKIHHIITEMIEPICLADPGITTIERQYGRILYLFHLMQYMRANDDFYNVSFEAACKILLALGGYYYNKDGVATIEQTRIQHELYLWTSRIVEFANANNFPEPLDWKKFKRQVTTVSIAAGHLTRPDGIMPSLGHSIHVKSKIKPLSGNFIKPGSNIAILSDGMAYITINSGQNINANNVHCDLLSFTFFYDNHQLIYDAGGGKDDLADYAKSSVAHSSLLCDDKNYANPDYFDWTSITDAQEYDEYVMISMSHNLIKGVTLTRKLIWCKPNIIILIDKAESDTVHTYTQNYIFPKTKVCMTDKSDITLQIKEGFTLKVWQLPSQNNNFDFDLVQYKGTSDIKTDTDQMRGSICSSWRKLLPGLNLAYNKTAKHANFLTVLEAHSGKEEEKTVENIYFDKGELIISAKDKEDMHVNLVGNEIDF